MVTVHYYQPFHFTHQGASWVGPESQKWLGTKWTGDKAQRQAVARDLDKAVAWAAKHRRPLYLGEFGAFSKADLESRAVGPAASPKGRSSEKWGSPIGNSAPVSASTTRNASNGSSRCGRHCWVAIGSEILKPRHSPFPEPLA